MSTRLRRDLLWSAAVTFVALGPMLLFRGFVLQGDMVFVPRQPWKEAWLGLDGAAGRFVPGDAVVSALTYVIPGDLLQKILLAGALLVGGLGAGRLVATQPAVGRAAAITLFLWNPWVLERLAIGQWGVVVGYLLLPWVVLAARGWRLDARAGWPALTIVLGLSAVCSPPAALMATLTAFMVAAVPRQWRAAGGVLGISALVNLPWLLPSLLARGPLPAAEGQFAAFATTGESGAGAVASVLSLGGIWKASVVPPEREVAIVVVLAGVLTVVALLGYRRSRDLDADTRLGMGLLAGTSLLIALLPAYAPVQDLLDEAARGWSAVGLLRDSHRFLAPAVLVLVVGVAQGTAWVWGRARPGAEAMRAFAVLLVLWPILCLPSLAWGLRGDLTPVDYPREWAQVRTLMNLGADRPTVVLPWRGGYRGFAWNDGTASLDPAPRYFPGDVLIDDRLFLGERTLPSEDPLLAGVAEALAGHDPAAALTELGIGRVLVEKDNGQDLADVPEGRVVHDGPGLRLVELAAAAPLERTTAPRQPVLWGDVLAVSGVLIALAAKLRRAVYGVRQRNDPWEGN
jgi:hypothetical protein